MSTEFRYITEPDPTNGRLKVSICVGQSGEKYMPVVGAMWLTDAEWAEFERQHFVSGEQAAA